METVCSTVDLALVDPHDLDFAVESFSGSELLQASLDRHGILDPPSLLAREDGRFTIVDGFKRLRWASAKGVGAVSCIVFPAGCDRTELMLRRVEGKLFGPPLNTAEKARIVSKLARIPPLQQFASLFSRRLNIAPREDVIRTWCRLADCDERFLAAVARDEVSDRAALELAKWDGESRAAVVRLLAELRCSASIQMELVERVAEIALIRGETKWRLIGSAGIGEILEDPASNHRQKTERVRELLRQWRFPKLTARERRFAKDLFETALPAGIQVIPPPAFEGERWQMKVTFSSARELKSLLERAESLADSSALARLMHPESPEAEDE